MSASTSAGLLRKQWKRKTDKKEQEAVGSRCCVLQCEHWSRGSQSRENEYTCRRLMLLSFMHCGLYSWNILGCTLGIEYIWGCRLGQNAQGQPWFQGDSDTEPLFQLAFIISGWDNETKRLEKKSILWNGLSWGMQTALSIQVNCDLPRLNSSKYSSGLADCNDVLFFFDGGAWHLLLLFFDYAHS